MRLFRFLIALGLVCISSSYVLAKVVSSPEVKEGEFWLKEDGFYDLEDTERLKTGLEFGYGFNDRLAGDMKLNFSDKEKEDFRASSFRLRTQYLFNKEQDGIIPQAALRVSYDTSTVDDADVFAAEILTKHVLGQYNLTGNYQLSQNTGVDKTGGTQGLIALQFDRNINDYLGLGAEYYGAFGQLANMKDYDQQQHQIGPVVYLKSKDYNLTFETGVLFALSEAAPDAQLKWELKKNF